MRYRIVVAALAAAALSVSGCKGAPNVSAPTNSDQPSAPKPAVPATPAAPSAPRAPSGPPAPSSVQAPRAVDKTPIKADVSKIKFTATPAELFGWDDGESRAFFYTNGLGEVVVKVPEDGDYDIVITASCQAAKGENAKFKLKVDGTQVGAETQLRSEDAKDYTFSSALKAGERKIGTEYTNDIYKEGEYDLNFFLHGVKIVRK
jgi:hypothetical protein